MNFYHKFLDLPESETSPDHYGLLGVPRFCDDAEQIHQALVTRSTQLRSWDNSKFFREANSLLDEVIEAAAILEDPIKKAVYDAELRQRLRIIFSPPRPPAAPQSTSGGVTEAEVLGWLSSPEHRWRERDKQTTPKYPLGVEQTSLDRLEIPPSVLMQMPASIAHEFTALPLANIDNRLRVAMSNIHDVVLLDKLRSFLNVDIEPVSAEKEAIQKAVIRHYGDSTTAKVSVENGKLIERDLFFLIAAVLIWLLILAAIAMYSDHINAFAILVGQFLLWVGQLLLGLLCVGIVVLSMVSSEIKGRRRR